MGTAESRSSKAPLHISGPVGIIQAGQSGNAMADVIGVEMHLNLFIWSGNLKGVKPLFTMGVMNDEFIKVIKAFQKQVVGSSNPDGRVDPNGKTLKFLNGPLDAKGGKIEPEEVKPPADVEAAREKIAQTALRYFHEGGHFLMGAIGDMPGRANGHPLRPAHTKPATFMDFDHPSLLGPSVNAAWTTFPKIGMLGCMGRPKTAQIDGDGLLTPVDPKVSELPAYMSIVRRMKDASIAPFRWPSLTMYLANKAKFLAATSDADLRKLSLMGPGPSEYPRRINSGGLIHLGESCEGIRHYDCIGFVNWVLSKVLRPEWKRAMEFYTTPSGKDLFHVREFASGGDLVAAAEVGDLVAKSPTDPHIGICAVHNGSLKVVNCRSMNEGLVCTKLKDEWKFLSRLHRV
jgi:hypothetical protein